MPHFLDGKTVTFTNYGSGTVIDLNHGSSADQTPITGWHDNSGDNQRWALKQVDTKYGLPVFLLRNVQSNTAMDLLSGGTGNGTEISGWWVGPETNPNQNWFIFSGDQQFNVVMIVNVGTGTCVDLRDGSSNNGTPISGWAGGASVNNSHQLWKVTIL